MVQMLLWIHEEGKSHSKTSYSRYSQNRGYRSSPKFSLFDLKLCTQWALLIWCDPEAEKGQTLGPGTCFNYWWGRFRCSIGIGFRYQHNSWIGNLRSNLRKFPIHELCLCFNVICWNDSISYSCQQTVKLISWTEACLNETEMRHASIQEIRSAVCS